MAQKSHIRWLTSIGPTRKFDKLSAKQGVQTLLRSSSILTAALLVGKQFYGPDGVYPFAGRECARALALLSTNISDCSDDLEGLEEMELDNLKNWQGQFYSKYKLVGDVIRPTAA